jgi:hypothetical protein
VRTCDALEIHDQAGGRGRDDVVAPAAVSTADGARPAPGADAEKECEREDRSGSDDRRDLGRREA